MNELKEIAKDGVAYYSGNDSIQVNYKTYTDYIKENSEYIRKNSEPLNEVKSSLDKYLDLDKDLDEGLDENLNEKHFEDEKKKYIDNLGSVTIKSRRTGSKLTEKPNLKNKKSEQDYKPFNYFPTIPKPKPIEKKSAPEPEVSINKNEELIINIEELADELAIENQKNKGDIKEYKELLKKYKTIILKHERTKKK